MDSNITDHPTIARRNTSVRLPGEELHGGEPPAQEAPGVEEQADAPPAPARSGRRSGLLTGVAAVSTVVLATAVFAVSPYNTILPVPWMGDAVRHAASRVGVTIPPSILAPSAALAGVVVAPPSPVYRQTFPTQARQAEVAELLALQPAARIAAAGPAATPRPLQSASTAGPSALVEPLQPLPIQRSLEPPPGYVAAEPGAVVASAASTQAANAADPALGGAAGWPVAPSTSSRSAAGLLPSHMASEADARPMAGTTAPDITSSVLAALGAHRELATVSQGSAPSSSRPPAGHAAPVDVVAQAIALRAAPMSPGDQVEVLAMVNQLAILVRDTRHEDAQLRRDLAIKEAAATRRVGDLERRVLMVEAGASLRAASQSTDDAASVAPPVTGVSASAVPMAPIVLTRAEIALPASGAATLAKRYRVQAASPGLAMLAEVDRSGTEAAQLSVSVGDTLPGYGVVRSISQHGTTWSVATDHGNIE